MSHPRVHGFILAALMIDVGCRRHDQPRGTTDAAAPAAIVENVDVRWILMEAGFENCEHSPRGDVVADLAIEPDGYARFDFAYVSRGWDASCLALAVSALRVFPDKIRGSRFRVIITHRLSPDIFPTGPLRVYLVGDTYLGTDEYVMPVVNW